MRPPKPVADRFVASIEEPFDAHNDCWNWRGSFFVSGYPRIKVSGRTLRAHRLSYELLVGPIPDGLTIDHLCGNKKCVNPAHLEPVTLGINVRRSPFTIASINKAKTHCKRGHELTPENVVMVPGGRSCRICQNMHSRNYRLRKGGK